LAHGLRVDPRDAVPIWRQIEDGVRRLIAGGSLRPGAPVPSVRELARDLGVNPATVAKAYQKLCDGGLLVVRRGEGTFVSAEPPAPARGERAREVREAAERYTAVAATLGATRGEAVAHVEAAWPREDGTKRGGSR
jgi:GntR family transcriptional regulator